MKGHFSSNRPVLNHHQNYRADIDGLRALAIIAVVIFHAFPTSLPGGFVGVDIFFVISGYLISNILFTNLKNDSFSFRDFYIRRIKRLFPALIAVLVTCYVIGWFLLLPYEYEQLGKHIAGSAAFSLNFVLWKEAGYFDQSALLKPLLHLWSLGCEEQFYLTWPLLIYFVHKWRLGFVRITLLIAATSIFLNFYTVDTTASNVFYLPFTRFWELLLGAILAGAPLQSSAIQPKSLNILSCAGLLFIIAAFLVTDHDINTPIVWAFLPTIGTFLSILSGPQTWINRNILSRSPVVWLGLISYPLYLWHWPLLVFLRIFFQTAPPVLWKDAAIALSVLLAWLTYMFIEKPVRFSIPSLKQPIVLLGAMFVLGCIGFFTYKSDGFLFRLPESVRSFVTTDSTYEHWQLHKCYLSETQKFESAEGCIEEGDKPLLLLWGDSHAAQLYPGLKALEKERDFRIAQFNTSACPPLLGWSSPDFPFCKPNNDFVFELIKKIQPAMILLSSRWDIGNRDYRIPLLIQTIHELKKIYHGRAIIIGPSPRWKYTDISTEAVTSLEMSAWRSGKLPDLRMDIGIPDVPIQDYIMQKVSEQSGAEYISAYDPLCNDQGCLTRTTDAEGKILLFDGDHLTPQASALLFHLVADQLFPQSQKTP